MDSAKMWADFVELLPVLAPTFLGSSGMLYWWVNRRDALAKAELDRAHALRAAEVENARKDAASAQQARIDERREMAAERDAFYKDIREEVANLRSLYAAEQERGVTLRTALAEAGQREHQLQLTILNLTEKVDQLQEMVDKLSQQLATEAARSRNTVREAVGGMA